VGDGDAMGSEDGEGARTVGDPAGLLIAREGL
jgi:hypothetical protein